MHTDINIHSKTTYKEFIDFYNKEDGIAKFVKTSERYIRKNFNDLYVEIIKHDEMLYSYYKDLNIVKNFPCKMWTYFHKHLDINQLHPVCLQCNKKVLKFNNIVKGYKTFCSKKCSSNSPLSIRKMQETCIKKYGHKSAMSDPKILEKKLKTSEENCLSKYNVTHYNKSDEYKNKQRLEKIKLLDDIGLKYSEIIDVEGEMRTIKCDICNLNYTRTYHFIKQRLDSNINPCTNCEPLNITVSKEEKELLEYIKGKYNGSITHDDRTVLNGQELDIYLPELNLAFEFNGVYWHNELHKPKNYHLNKTETCLEKGIQLIHVYEDDWNNKKEIVKSRIDNLLKISKRVYARKCVIKEVDFKESVEFLMNNHIQGICVDKIRLGLYYEDTLISLMTFGSLRRNLGYKNTEGDYELLRFCNKLNFSVIGGASRLFKYFLNKYSPKNVISYADRSWSKGGLYEQLKFEYVNSTNVNYFYVVDNIRRNRYKYRKNELVSQGYDSKMTEHEIMLSRKIYRIYDSGSLKYLYKHSTTG